MATGNFQVGDLVFAKLRGFPPWPAKIYGCQNKKYNVYYYGTDEVGVVNLPGLFKFPECRAQFVTEGKMKKGNFRAAVEQIDAALAGNDVAPANLYADTPSMADAVETQPIVMKIKIKQEVLEPGVTFEKFGAVSDYSEAESENVNEVKVTSRSGRKIKPKYFYEDLIAKGSIQAGKRKPGRSEVSRKPKCVPLTVPIFPPFKRKVKKWYNILPCFIFPKTFIGIKTNYKKPATFASVREEINWQIEADLEARNLKGKLEAGLFHPRVVRERIVFNLPMKRIPKGILKEYHADLIEKDVYLESEKKLCQLCDAIRNALTTIRPDVDRAIELLMDAKKLRLSQVMLLRNPIYVEIIRNLTNYVGKLKEWKLRPKEELLFKYKAQMIRCEAVLLYEKFRELFRLKESVPFYETFLKHVALYNKITHGCLHQQTLALSDEIYRECVAYLIRGKKIAARNAEKSNGKRFAAEEVGKKEEIEDCEDTEEGEEDAELDEWETDEEKENWSNSQAADANKNDFEK